MPRNNQCFDYNRVGNTVGEIELEAVDKRDNKMAVMIRRIFPLHILEEVNTSDFR